MSEWSIFKSPLSSSIALLRDGVRVAVIYETNYADSIVELLNAAETLISERDEDE